MLQARLPMSSLLTQHAMHADTQRKASIFDRNGRLYDEVVLPQPDFNQTEPNAPACEVLKVLNMC